VTIENLIVQGGSRLKSKYLLSIFLLSGALAAAFAQTTPINHVVVIFQENSSFDHYFATYPNALNPDGEPVFTPRTGRRAPSVNGLSGPLMTNNPNSVQPFRLDRSQAIVCDQGHNMTAEQKAMNGGAMNKFVETTGAGIPAGVTCNDAGKGKGLVMGYYDGNTVTALWNYAQHYAMSDNFFSTQFGPSTLGHLNLASGQTSGATVMFDSGNAASLVKNGVVVDDIRPALDDCVPAGASVITMAGPNVGDLLNQGGITWGWFQGGFAPSSRNADGTAVCANKGALFDGTPAVVSYIPNHNPFQFYQSTANPHHLPATSLTMIGQTDQANHQYDISDFFAALNAGILPAVSILKAPAYQDGHPLYSNPLDEQTFLVNTINALEGSPFWDTTAIIITYDDSDGWYDHAMPPIVNGSAADVDALNGAGLCGTANPNAPQGRCGYGQRLPLLIISPYAKVNFVDHSVTDQTSILKFIEDNWSLGRIGGSSFDAIAGSLANMLDFNENKEAGQLFLDPATGLPQ
jgi:phospholipase C